MKARDSSRARCFSRAAILAAASERASSRAWGSWCLRTADKASTAALVLKEGLLSTFLFRRAERACASSFLVAMSSFSSLEQREASSERAMALRQEVEDPFAFKQRAWRR